MKGNLNLSKLLKAIRAYAVDDANAAVLLYLFVDCVKEAFLNYTMEYECYGDSESQNIYFEKDIEKLIEEDPTDENFNLLVNHRYSKFRFIFRALVIYTDFSQAHEMLKDSNILMQHLMDEHLLTASIIIMNNISLLVQNRSKTAVLLKYFPFNLFLRSLVIECETTYRKKMIQQITRAFINNPKDFVKDLIPYAFRYPDITICDDIFTYVHMNQLIENDTELIVLIIHKDVGNMEDNSSILYIADNYTGNGGLVAEYALYELLIRIIRRTLFGGLRCSILRIFLVYHPIAVLLDLLIDINKFKKRNLLLETIGEIYKFMLSIDKNIVKFYKSILWNRKYITDVCQILIASTLSLIQNRKVEKHIVKSLTFVVNLLSIQQDWSFWEKLYPLQKSEVPFINYPNLILNFLTTKDCYEFSVLYNGLLLRNEFSALADFPQSHYANHSLSIKYVLDSFTKDRFFTEWDKCAAHFNQLSLCWGSNFPLIYMKNVFNFLKQITPKGIDILPIEYLFYQHLAYWQPQYKLPESWSPDTCLWIQLLTQILAGHDNLHLSVNPPPNCNYFWPWEAEKQRRAISLSQFVEHIKETDREWFILTYRVKITSNPVPANKYSDRTVSLIHALLTAFLDNGQWVTAVRFSSELRVYSRVSFSNLNATIIYEGHLLIGGKVHKSCEMP